MLNLIFNILNLINYKTCRMHASFDIEKIIVMPLCQFFQFSLARAASFIQQLLQLIISNQNKNDLFSLNSLSSKGLAIQFWRKLMRAIIFNTPSALICTHLIMITQLLSNISNFSYLACSLSTYISLCLKYFLLQLFSFERWTLFISHFWETMFLCFLVCYVFVTTRLWT